MSEEIENKNDYNINSTLDLRGNPCPINFVKAKLKLEELNSDDILEIILDCGDPIANVPRSLKEEGHKVIGVKKIDDYYKLLVRRQ